MKNLRSQASRTYLKDVERNGAKVLDRQWLNKWLGKVSQKQGFDYQVVDKAKAGAEKLLEKDVSGMVTVNNGQVKLIIRSDATRTELIHEALHVWHFKKHPELWTKPIPKQFPQMGTPEFDNFIKTNDAWKQYVEREQYVFDQMRSWYWNEMSSDEKRVAIDYLKRTGGVIW